MNRKDFWGNALRVPHEEGALEVTFMNRSGPRRVLGRLAAIWLDGRVVRGERHGTPLAVNYYSIETDARVTLQLEGDDHTPSPVFGPFGSFSIVDRLVYADGRAFALFNPRVGAWLCYDAGRHWPSLVVSLLK